MKHLIGKKYAAYFHALFCPAKDENDAKEIRFCRYAALIVLVEHLEHQDSVILVAECHDKLAAQALYRREGWVAGDPFQSYNLTLPAD